jgi:hypothetical protein
MVVREVVETEDVLRIELNLRHNYKKETIPVAFSVSSIKDAKGEELEKFEEVTVGRELKMIELEKEIEMLKEKMKEKEG